MKCSKCGSEVNDNAIFCEECGTEIPRPKDCPRCHSRVKPSAKFCLKCGYQFPANATGTAQHAASGAFFRDKNLVAGDVKQTSTQNGIGRGSAGASLGDKNMIAGDVNQVAIGRQENIHLGDGATYVKHEDETKTVVKCHICGRINTIANFFECPKCHEMTCEKDYNRDLKLCANCKEKEYQAAFRDARENGGRILSPEQRKKLEKYKIAADKAEELHREVIRSETWRPAADDESNVDYFLFVQGSINDAYTLLRGMEEDEREKYNSMFLSRLLYISLKNVSRGKDNELLTELKKMQDSTSAQAKQSPRQEVSADSAVETANRIVELVFQPGNDILGVYLVLIDQILEKQPFPERVRSTLRRAFDVKADTGMSAFARKLLEKAEDFWPNSVLLKCRRILYALMQFEETGRSKYKEDAEKDMESLPVLTNSASVMERSWIAKVRREMHAETFDPTPQYCEEKDLFFFVLNPWCSESFCKMADSLDTTVKPLRDEYFKMVMTAATEFPSPSSGVLKKLGDCYADGIGTRKDVPAALLCYQKAAEAEGVFFTVDGTVFRSYRDNGSRAEYTVPDGITEIADGAFAGCELTKVRIPPTVKTICTGAFRNCKALLSVELSEGLNHIQRKAFEGCDSLKSITIPMSVSRLEEEFDWSCAVLFVGDRPVEAASFEFDGCVFSVPEIVGIRTVLHSFSRKVRNAEDRVSWCSPTTTPDCDRKCGSCLLCSERGIAAQKILAFMMFSMKFCAEHGIRIPMPDTPKPADAAFALAGEYACGKIEKLRDVSKAAAWYREAAESGHAKAQFLFAVCCFNGIGTREDKAEAVKWYRKAAEQGIAEAQLKLAGCCFDGIGTREDKAEAFSWYRKAIGSIQSTDVQSMYQIGECFFHGWGTKRDYSEAVKWYRKAAEQRLGAAQFKLAECCINGFGIKQDKIKAFEWYRKAADQGVTDARAQMILGEGYFNGWNMDAGDYYKALYAYRKATTGEGNCFFADYTPQLLLKHILKIAAKRPEENIRNTTAEILRDVFAKAENCSTLNSDDWVSLLTQTDGIPVEHCNWESFTGKNWIDLLSIKPKYADYCGLTVDSQKTYWTKIIDDQLKALADKQPKFRVVHDLRNGRNVSCHLKDNPEAFKFCRFPRVSKQGWIELLKDAELIRRLVKSDPDIFSKYCPWDSFDDENRINLLSVSPEYACLCKKGLSVEGWSRILKNAELTWRLVKSDPKFLASCPWDRFSSKQWTELLCMDALKGVLTSDVLAHCPWNRFTGNDWENLLIQKPEYADRCIWKNLCNVNYKSLKKNVSDQIRNCVNVNNVPISVVVNMGWEKYRDWRRITTGKEWCDILKEYPVLDKFCNWNLLDGKDWANLLSCIPEFKDRCQWKKLNKDDWDTLLDKQPDMVSFFPCNFHAILNYPDCYSKGKPNAICKILARKFSFFAACACMLVFTIISLWGDAGWFALFSESWKHALVAGAVWLVAAVLCAIFYARIWGDFFLLRWLNLGHAFFVSFSFFTIYHWSFYFSMYSFCLVLCGILSFLLFIFPVIGKHFDLDSFSFYLIPYFSVFSWFLLSPVEWSGWLIFLMILLFIVLCVIGLLKNTDMMKGGLADMDDIKLIGVFGWLIPSLIIGGWSLLMPVKPDACYKMAEELQTSFPSASQAFYRKGQSAVLYRNAIDRDYAKSQYALGKYDKAVEAWSRAAEWGDAESQFRLGDCYHEGSGVKRYEPEAVNWYRKAAEQDHVEAQATLGKYLFEGKYTTKDETEAVKWWRKAAEQGNVAAQFNLGKCYEEGIGVKLDYDEAFKWYSKAAEKGNAEAKTKADSLRGAVRLLNAAERGDVDAMTELAVCFEEGKRFPKDLTESLNWYQKAAEKGHAEAQFRLAQKYSNGLGVSKNETEAVKWYQKAAEQGNAEAQLELGKCYYFGEGVDTDYKKAVKWYRAAAEQGNGSAQLKLARCYESGVGVNKDYAEALAWYLKAAERGHNIDAAKISSMQEIVDLFKKVDLGDAEAQLELAKRYEKGIGGMNKDDAESAKWYRKTAEQGNAEAQSRVGKMYYNGEGVKADLHEAVNWYRKAAEQGMSEAQYLLGKCYCDGAGVRKDEAEALNWYLKAAEQGHTNALEAIHNLANTDNPEILMVLGTLYNKGTVVPVDQNKAVQCFLLAAEQGRTDGIDALVAQAKAGNQMAYQAIRQLADGGNQKAWNFIASLAEQDRADAQFYLGECYYNGVVVSKNVAEAVKWYRKAAEQGYAEAQYDLGICYEEGYGVAKDMFEAFKWYRKAAEQGHAKGQFELGESYYRGRGVSVNDHEAVKWFRKAAEQGHAEALFKLGILLYNGFANYHDKTEGFSLISRAAAQGQQDAIQFLNSLSQTSSGSSSKTSGTPDGSSSAASTQKQEDADALYKKGRDYAWHENDKEAMVWFRKAAELGHAGAQREVGDDYYWKREYTNASMWYLKSALQGNKSQGSIPLSQLDSMARNGNQAALDALIRLDQEGFSVARAYLKSIASTPDDYLSPKFREALRKYK